MKFIKSVVSLRYEFCDLDIAGAPNENIVQNHLDTASLKDLVF